MNCLFTMHQLLAPVNAADQPILDRARRIYKQEFSREISSIALRELNSRLGIDIATAVLYVHFESMLLKRSAGSIPDAADRRPLMVAIAPGAFYKEHPEVGGDGRELIELSQKHLWDCQRIPSESLGTLMANAKIINTFLTHATQSHRVILVSLSKGTTDARTAQTLRPDLFESLTAWISVSGVASGTMMADWLLDKWYLRLVLSFMLWRHGTDHQAVVNMRYCRQQSFETAFVEPTAPMIHIAGFPLQRHLSCRRARLWHRRFRRQGPNDSVVMLEDLLQLQGTVIPVWGADHYLRGNWNVAESMMQLIAFLNGDGNLIHHEDNICSSRESLPVTTRV